LCSGTEAWACGFKTPKAIPVAAADFKKVRRSMSFSNEDQGFQLRAIPEIVQQNRSNTKA